MKRRFEEEEKLVRHFSAPARLSLLSGVRFKDWI